MTISSTLGPLHGRVSERWLYRPTTYGVAGGNENAIHRPAESRVAVQRWPRRDPNDTQSTGSWSRVWSHQVRAGTFVYGVRLSFIPGVITGGGAT